MCPITRCPGPVGNPQPAPPMPFSAPLTLGLCATVLIGGKPAAVVGASGMNTPPHVGPASGRSVHGASDAGRAGDRRAARRCSSAGKPAANASALGDLLREPGSARADGHERAGGLSDDASSSAAAGPSRCAPTPRAASASSTAAAELEEAIRLILGTAFGERPMRPDFGCGIHDLVFATPDATTRGPGRPRGARVAAPLGAAHRGPGRGRQLRGHRPGRPAHRHPLPGRPLQRPAQPRLPVLCHPRGARRRAGDSRPSNPARSSQP